jgi:hypothetical protein
VISLNICFCFKLLFYTRQYIFLLNKKKHI